MASDEKQKKKALLRTCYDLREEDEELSKQLHKLERKYKDFYKPVFILSETYTHCKDTSPWLRYGNLKDMIKTCKSEVMKIKAEYFAEPNMEDQRKHESLLQAAKQFSSHMADITATIEELQLRNAKIERDIRDKKRKINNIGRNLTRLQNRTDKLERDYVESKQHFLTRRYPLMKGMIKLVIRDEALKALFSSIPVIV